MKILFEKIPDYKTSCNTDVSCNSIKITIVTLACIKLILSPKESHFEKELEEEQEACNQWNTRHKQIIEQSKNAVDCFEDMSQYDCYTCSHSHYHSPPKVRYSHNHVVVVFSFLIQITIAEHQGYEFCDPFPCSMRKVNITFMSD